MDWRFVHFTAHGLVNEERPSLSGIFLWPDTEETVAAEARDISYAHPCFWSVDTLVGGD